MATINFVEWTEAGGTPANSTQSSIRFHNGNDNGGTASTDPLIRPTGGDNWSYNKYIDVQVVDGTWSTINSPTLSATGVSAGGQLLDSGATNAGVYLYYAFHETASASTEPALAGDYSQEINGAGPATAHPITPNTGAWAAWPATSPFSYGNVTSITDNNTDRLFSAESSLTGREYLALALKISSAVATGGALAAFTMTLSYNEI